MNKNIFRVVYSAQTVAQAEYATDFPLNTLNPEELGWAADGLQTAAGGGRWAADRRQMGSGWVADGQQMGGGWAADGRQMVGR